MAYFSVGFVLLVTTLCVNSQPVTLHYSRTHTGKVKSGRGVSPDHNKSLVGCAVQSALKPRSDQCFFYDVSHGSCDASSLPLLCNYRQLNKPTDTNKKILFLVCRYGAMCKFTFVPGPGVVNTTKIHSYALSYDILDARYHQPLNKFFWTKGLLGTCIYSTIASSGEGKKYHHKKMPFRVITFDIDSNVNYLFVLSDKAIHKGDISTNDFVTLVQGRFYRPNRLFVDRYNRRVYYTCTRKGRQDLMHVSYDGKLHTRTAKILTGIYSFLVDDKGWNVFFCKRGLYRYNVNTTESTQLKALGAVKCSGMTSNGQDIYVPAMGKILVLSMDSSAIISTLQVATRNRKPESYLPVIVPDPK